jgi:hypothetical protein
LAGHTKMAATNFTPISLYYSATASSVPTAGNLVAGELAINTNDGKLFYKDSSGVVQTLASKAGALGDVVGPASATDNALARFDLTTGKLIQNSVGILSDAGALTGITDFTYTGALTGGTGIVNLGSGQFYKDASGNVGIGTSSPAYKLDVSGVIRNATSADGSPYTQQRITVYNDGSNWGYFGYGVDALMRVVYSSTATSAPLLFGTTSAANNTGTFTETMRISATSALVLKGGATNPSGVGITFPATQSASTDANTLDDYEEGTWTPTLTASVTNPTVTYLNQVGFYTKVGRMVSIQGRLQISLNTGGVGEFRMSGLPFTNSANIVGAGTSWFSNLDLAAGKSMASLYFSGNNNYLSLAESGDNTSAEAMAIGKAASTFDIAFAFTYIV